MYPLTLSSSRCRSVMAMGIVVDGCLITAVYVSLAGRRGLDLEAPPFCFFDFGCHERVTFAFLRWLARFVHPALQFATVAVAHRAGATHRGGGAPRRTLRH